MIAVVQFTHPGAEHILNRDDKKVGSNIKLWNYGGHRRKYMLASGSCISDVKVLHDQDLLFWGEWEPMSKVAPISKHQGSGALPTLIQYPYLETDKNGKVLVPWNNGKFRTVKGNKVPLCRQNTDPFVFGNSFYYCCCKQGFFKKMKQLEMGSIILFGSTVSLKQGGPFFVLDTVFVVSDYRNYTPATYQKDLQGFIPNTYDEIMGFKHWNEQNAQLVCYKGATINESIDGMFSYVPCKMKEEEIIGFPRIKINNGLLSGIITDNLNAAPKFSAINNSAMIKGVWNEISKQVEEQGYMKGFDFKYNKVIVP